MDLISTLGALKRHWILTIVLLLLTLAGSAAVTFGLPWTYQAQSTVVLLSSRQASKLNGYNPYLSFDGAVTNTAYVVGVIVTGPADKKAFVAEGDTGMYTVGLSPNTDGPVLVATVTAQTKADAENTLKAVTAAIATNLRDIQTAKNITGPNQIRAEVASITPEATLLVSKKAKSIGLVLALGLFATVGLPIITDARAARRLEEKRTAMRGSAAGGRPPGRRPSAAPRPAGQRSETDYPARDAQRSEADDTARDARSSRPRFRDDPSGRDNPSGRDEPRRSRPSGNPGSSRGGDPGNSRGGDPGKPARPESPARPAGRAGNSESAALAGSPQPRQWQE
jgi:hypothetical protein